MSSPRTSRGFAPLALLLLLGAACAEKSDRAIADEADAAVAQVLSERRNYVGLTQEEFVLAMERLLDSYGTILAGIGELQADGATADRASSLERRRAEMAEEVLTLKTDLDGSWVNEREALVETSSELERDLLAAWHDLREP